jgi:hypothetical protein
MVAANVVLAQINSAKVQLAKAFLMGYLPPGGVIIQLPHCLGQETKVSGGLLEREKRISFNHQPRHGPKLWLSPRRDLRLETMNGGLSQLGGPGIPNPNDFEPRFPAGILYPNEIARAHLTIDSRQQRSTGAYAGRNHILREQFSRLVSPLYGNE